MTDAVPPKATAPKRTPQDWVRVLANYREPHLGRSLYELGVSLIPFLALWALAFWALSISGWLALGIAVLNAGFLVRLFVIQHDCGHGSYFRNRHVSDWVGRALGVLTLTPYDVWRRSHAIHHSSAGNLDKRGMGDVHTLTVEEYRALSVRGRLGYRLYRSPFVMFLLGPTYLFLLQNRLPFGLMRAGAKYWTNAMATNAAIAIALGLIFYFGGVMPILLIFLPTVLIAATIGVWLFYVQHQFEETVWHKAEDWQLHDAALMGSSHYVLPGVLQWMTANIGIHHVHHLYSRIPFYRLTEVLRDHPVLAGAQRLTIRESLSCARLHLWDEHGQRLLSFAQARQLPVQA
ncbi:fatty acid desaturase [Thalassovita taeanensis]|uniref:Omega-6 fatty acid desaturase (Delta-12 desaturase) n=1 Tax=Thalassovita taeanensis TaxID=657014 RepID=A0A1H9DSW4_9RHOB|nr:fatty acid desaturase [Thalassovita taeanensis]SEQ16580.1 omega-6 fatty acid desaturase (delta-12 desaturase) [Thalassovita taeanensis]